MKTVQICAILILSLSRNGFSQTNVFPPTGNVGIGTTNPSAKLEVDGTILSRMTNEGGWDIAFGASEGNGLLIGKINGSTNTSADKAHILYRNSNGGIYYGYNSSGATTTVINSQNSGNSYFNSGGNVGIGTITPQSKLHISTSNSMVLRFERPSSDVFGFEVSGTIGGFYNYSTSKWVWRANNGNMLLAETSGNVGIGTNAPDAKLTVKGTIHTEEVKVDLNGVLAPDYVFDESYDLLSLDEVDDYINTHKHLPEVPSANAMEKDGLNLKEMNLLLLKKVEELTLYVIELKKENEQQEEKIEQLRRQ